MVSSGDPSKLRDQTTAIVANYVKRNRLDRDDLPDLIRAVHAALAGLPDLPAAPALAAPQPIADALIDSYLSSKTFCAAPWVHFLTLPDGSVLPCCRAKEALRRPDGSGFNIRQEGPEEIWNSPAYKQIRQSLLNGEKISHCTSCYEIEADNFTSYRQVFNRNYIESHGAQRRQAFLDRLVDPSDPLTVRKPLFFDIRMGNICNLKCRMCGPGLSSQIEKDDIASAWVGKSSEIRIGESVDDWPEAADLLTQLKDFSIDAVRLELVGGEPTLNRGQMEILKHFVDRDLAGRVELLMITNMTNAQERVYNLVNQFRHPNVHISVEAVGPVNDYIRFPGKWDAIAAQFAKIRRKFKNISFGVSPTFQAYNVLNVCDLFDWCQDNDVPFTSGNILMYPDWLSVRVLPYPVRIVAAEKLEAWAGTRADALANKKDVLELAGYLRDPNQTATEDQIDAFVRYTNDLDRSRKQDIRTSLPELYELWTSHRPWDHQAFRHA
jgi:MoaA/NifB/PqqE/SkfB family radical SAM enzyme